MRRKMSNAERLIESVDDAIKAAHKDELTVILILNSVTQCRKIVEQIRLREPEAVTAVQNDMWVVSFIGKPHARITLYPMYNVPADSYSKKDESDHWEKLRGQDFHKGNSRAFLSPIGPYIRRALN